MPEPWLSQYKGAYDSGYDAVRNQRLLRQKELGLVPNDYTISSQPLPNTPIALSATPNYDKPNASYINTDSIVDPKIRTIV